MVAAILLCLTKIPTLCIDPGHPSEVGLGTRGRHISEVKLAWQVAKRLEAEMKSRGWRVVVTKHSEGERVTNRKRAEIANACHADLMLRLHCDAASGTGFTVFYPDRQGRINGTQGPSKELLREVRPIAERFHESLSHELRGFLRDNGLKSDIRTQVGAHHGALIGSIFSKVPVVLVEMCVLTNRTDESKLSSKIGQIRLASALAKTCAATFERSRTSGAR